MKKSGRLEVEKTRRRGCWPGAGPCAAQAGTGGHRLGQLGQWAQLACVRAGTGTGSRGQGAFHWRSTGPRPPEERNEPFPRACIRRSRPLFMLPLPTTRRRRAPLFASAMHPLAVAAAQAQAQARLHQPARYRPSQPGPPAVRSQHRHHHQHQHHQRPRPYGVPRYAATRRGRVMAHPDACHVLPVPAEKPATPKPAMLREHGSKKETKVINTWLPRGCAACRRGNSCLARLPRHRRARAQGETRPTKTKRHVESSRVGRSRSRSRARLHGAPMTSRLSTRRR